MSAFLNRIAGSRRHWRIALLLLGLLASTTVQLAAATHWHKASILVVATDHSAPQAPARDSNDRDGCLLCQVVAHASAAAPPPAPWVLVDVLESGAVFSSAAPHGIAVIQPSHSWQGRAPPQV